jgi:hypothetical protein
MCALSDFGRPKLAEIFLSRVLRNKSIRKNAVVFIFDPSLANNVWENLIVALFLVLAMM